MANSTDTGWEKAILDRMTGNGERIAVIERDVSEMKQDLSTLKQDMSEMKQDISVLKTDMQEVKQILGWLKWIGGAVVTIALALVAKAVSTYVFGLS